MTLNARESGVENFLKIKPMIIELDFREIKQNSEKFDSETSKL